MINVGVFGAAGRMGSTVCTTVQEAEDCELVGVVDPKHAGEPLAKFGVESGLTIAKDFGGLTVDVAVDFTTPEAAFANAKWCGAHGIHAVIGTTGLNKEQLDEIAGAFTSSHVVVAPNFAIGAALMMRFAEQAAPYFESAEVIELHHDRKADAPSGTALTTAQRIVQASETWNVDPTSNLLVEGARGANVGGIPVHSVRMAGLVAHQEVLFGTTGQTLSIRHDTTDRSAFMPGVLLAIRKLMTPPGLGVGLTLGLDALL